ncbi:ABC transporter permease [Plantactinospora siamensis]|uniref:ABC transporter permease n=1 Tax=Plantactinospora siamensis TaxID=555372 RepID=A0ABV6NRU2_9ACTN
MSAGDGRTAMAAAAGTRLAADGATRPARRFSGRLFRSELRLIYGRLRNQIGIAGLAALPVVIAVGVRLSAPDDQGGGGDFFSSITSNGFFVALAALTVELPIFLPIAVAAISSDAVAGEANLGTLRYLLTVPVSRNRLLAVKYAAVAVFALSVTLLVAVVGVLIGLALFGGGPVTLLSGAQIGLGEGLLRLLAVCGYLTVCLCALGAVGLFASTLTEQPMGATIAVSMLTVANFVLDNIPQLGWLHPYLLTHHWQDFGELLRSPVDPYALTPGLVSAGAYILIFLAAAWARFGGRDVTS